MAYLTESEALARLKEACEPHGATRALAQKIGCADSYLYAVKTGKASMSEKVAEALGLRPVRMFEVLEGANVAAR